MLKSILGALIAAVVLGGGCGTYDATMPEPRTAPGASPTTLGSGDVFEVRVYGEEELTGIYRVSSDGTISFPLVGSLPVDGQSPQEVSDLLKERLAQFIHNPHVTVFVKEYNSKKVYVLGRVKAPGTFPFEVGMSIIQAITLSGGFDALANENGTYVTRIVDGREVRKEVPVKDIGEGQAPNFVLEPGDIVYVPESIF